jgi:hypothetical protein
MRQLQSPGGAEDACLLGEGAELEAQVRFSVFVPLFLMQMKRRSRDISK